MRRIFILLTILFIFTKVVAQSEKGKIIIVQKFYLDTLKIDYRKVKYEVNKNVERVKRMDYSSAHASDTITVRKINEYNYENGYFVSANQTNQKQLNNIETYKVGDTMVERKANYLTKKVYSKKKIIYASRFVSEQRLIPYNELKYFYNKVGDLIEIKEKYNSEVNEEYKTIFNYNNGIVSRITEFKKFENIWLKEKIWEYDLLTKNNIKKKKKRRINNFLLDNQFLQPPF